MALPSERFRRARPGIFLKLVGTVEIRRVRRGVEARADAESVDGSAPREEVAHPVLVETAAHEDRGIVEAARVEDAADLPGVVRKVAAVEPHALDADALGPQPRRERHHLPGRRLGVVGVEQERQA